MAPYRELLAWQAAHEMAVCAYKLTSSWPAHERFGITSQLRRAAVSVPTNITEGAARRGSKDFRKFLGYALASTVEVEYLLGLAYEIGIATAQDRDTLTPLVKRAGQLTYRLIRSL